MLTKKAFSAVVTLTLLVALGTVAAGQGRAARIARLKDYLALTDEQTVQITGLLKQHQEAVFPLRQQLRSKNQELRLALEATEPDPNAVGSLVIARSGLNKQLHASNAKLRNGIQSILTPEQKQKFQRLRAGMGRAARPGMRRMP